MAGGNVEAVTYFIFLSFQITADGDWNHEIQRFLLPGRKAMTNLNSILKSRDKTFSTKVHIVKANERMWELDHKEGWAPKNWCFWTVVLEKTLESPLDSTELKPVSFKENQPWILIGRTDAGAEAPIFWSPDANSQLIEKDLDPGKDWRQEKRASEDEMAGWHHQCNGHELEQTSGDGEGQRGLLCCSPWVVKSQTP